MTGDPDSTSFLLQQLNETLRNNPYKARKVNCTVRYIDDLTINNPFEDEIGNIYPKELQLKKDD